MYEFNENVSDYIWRDSKFEERRKNRQRRFRERKRREMRAKCFVSVAILSISVLSVSVKCLAADGDDYSENEENIYDQIGWEQVPYEEVYTEEVPTEAYVETPQETVIESIVTDIPMEEPVTEEFPIIEEPVITAEYQENQQTAYPASEDEILLFEQILAAESFSYWQYEDMLSLATVIINRYNSDKFPNSIQGILTQRNQFETYSNGRYKTAIVTDECRMAVQDALNGKTNLNSNVMWFCTKGYYDSSSKYDFFKKLEHVYTCRNVYFFTE
jgi:hypothetical protein